MSLKANALTTVQRVADFMGLGTLVVGSAKYNKIELLINQVTSIIENYIGWQVKSEAVSQEVYDTELGDILVLKRRFVSAVTLERRNSGLNEDDWETIDAENYHIDADAGIIHGAGGWRFNRTRGGFRVSYTAGFVFDNSATFLSDTDGADIELAASMMITSIYNRSKGGAGIKSESIGDYRVSYGSGGIAENEDISSLLDKYADITLGGGLTPDHY